MNPEDSTSEESRTPLSPTEAFELLAHETRMSTLRVLWKTGEPLRFSEISDRANISDTGNFNYHLGQLVGHFVREVDGEYALTRSGRRAMTAVLAGDLTERHSLARVGIDAPCPYCGEDIVIVHEADALRAMCSSCQGTFRGERPVRDSRAPDPAGTITTLPLPRGGIGDRTPVSVLNAALARFVARNQQIAGRVCPDCGGPVEVMMRACPDHAEEGICEVCGSRFAGIRRFRCQTCGQRKGGVLALLALNDSTFHTYFFEHGFNFLTPTWQEVVVALEMRERVYRVDPLEYEAVWSVNGDQLSMQVDSQRETVSVVRNSHS